MSDPAADPAPDPVPDPAPDPAPDPVPDPVKTPVRTPVPVIPGTPGPDITRTVTKIPVGGGDQDELGATSQGEFPKLVGFNDGGVFRYVDLVTGEEFTDTQPKFGRVPQTEGITATDSFRIITRSSTKPGTRIVKGEGFEHRVSRLGVRSRAKDNVSASGRQRSPFGGKRF